MNITTVEELNALPTGSVVQAADGDIWQCRCLGTWDNLSADGSDGLGWPTSTVLISGPAILYGPVPTLPVKVPGTLTWKFDGGRGAVLDENQRIIGYLPRSFLPSVEEVAWTLAVSNETVWDHDPINPHDVYMRDARAVLDLIGGGGHA